MYIMLLLGFFKHTIHARNVLKIIYIKKLLKFIFLFCHDLISILQVNKARVTLNHNGLISLICNAIQSVFKKIKSEQYPKETFFLTVLS